MVDLGAKVAGVNTQGAKGMLVEQQKQKEIDGLKDKIKKLMQSEKDLKSIKDKYEDQIKKQSDEIKKQKQIIDKLNIENNKFQNDISTLEDMNNKL